MSSALDSTASAYDRSTNQQAYPSRPLNRRLTLHKNSHRENSAFKDNSAFRENSVYRENTRPIRTISLKRHEHLSFVHYSLWRIRAGYIRTLTHNAEGDFVPMGFWSVGDIVGYPIVKTHPYIAECLTTVEVECLSVNHPISHDMVISQIKQSTSLLRIAYCRDSQQRILQFICWLAEHFGNLCADGIQIHLRLTHQEIAESVGTTRVTVTRLLKALEQDGQLLWKPNEKIVFHKTFEQYYIQA